MYSSEKWSRINYQPCIPLGDNSSKITGCKRHIELSRRAAEEGTVLLKNNDRLLPLKSGARVAVFGKAQIDYVMCGGGSGWVYTAYAKNIYESLKDAGFDVFDSLSLFYKDEVEKQYKAGGKNGMLVEPLIPEKLLNDAKSYSDTAVITINRYSQEEEDRYNDGKDKYFNLSDEEISMINLVTESFENVIVLLNTGAMIDASWFAFNDKIKAALMISQGGMEGAAAVANILCGKVCPSGKLVDTCAADFNDYPSSEGFHESEDYVKYTEDIFVGYRYFETIPGKAKSVIYPFGYGLSYTSFEISNVKVFETDKTIDVMLTVKNTGDVAGKEVVQLYYSAPEGKITKAKKELAAFKKTKLLNPGESESVHLSFDIADMASFDDAGDVCKDAYVMETGEYKLYVGNSVTGTKELEYKYVLNDDTIVQKLNAYCTPTRLDKRLTASGEYVPVSILPKQHFTFECVGDYPERIPQTDEERKTLMDVYEGKISIDDFICQLTTEELVALTHGQPNMGVANTDGMGNLPKYGIPSVMTVDGPAGVRIEPKTGIRTTCFPVATMLACTWNTDLVEEIGKAGALECKENNLYIWLTPALNIHRSPLCGRNFEYYSEDPYISGKMAAAMVRGIQSQGVIATPKHFACNNKETNRKKSDSIVSARALREIYIKGFEICIKDSNPKLIMTSYNLMNGINTSEDAELITGILRGEWGYRGLVTTDWWNFASKTAEIIAGNDIRMPANSLNDVPSALNEGKITRNQLAVCVKRLLEMILTLE